LHVEGTNRRREVRQRHEPATRQSGDTEAHERHLKRIVLGGESIKRNWQIISHVFSKILNVAVFFYGKSFFSLTVKFIFSREITKYQCLW